MTEDLLESSDSIRSANPLRFAKKCAVGGPLKLERGGVLEQVEVVYETWGTPNAEKSNAILICHALSGDSHAARHHEKDDPGWWDVMIGPGKPIDTDRYFVICPNILGGCRGTTGPSSIDPKTGTAYAHTFPIITVGDIAEIQRRLIDKLGIGTLLAVIGGSLGGHVALTWATRFAERVRGVVPIATSARLTSQALAFDVVGRNAIRNDPDDGLAIARMLGHITYLSREAMMQKFDPCRLEPREIRSDFETRFSVGSYLAHQGDKFVERFDPNSYIALSTAMDLFDLGGTAGELAKSLAPSTCRWLVISFSSDWLFPPFQSRQIVEALIGLGKPVSYCNITSTCGHDAFLLPDDLPLYGEMVRGFLASEQDRHEGRQARRHEGEADGSSPSCLGASVPPCLNTTSIFHHHRLDYDTILELIPADSSVLDLGCGEGALLERLRSRGHQRIMGLELDQHEILASMRRGLDVVHGDLNHGLAAFADGQFDVVVLSQTLQTVLTVGRVLDDMLRVGRLGIVSFPNLAYHRLRQSLADRGRAPRSGQWVGESWHDTPSVRFLSIADFEDFCSSRGIRIVRQIALDTEQNCIVQDDPNLNADVAVVVISR